MQNLMGLLSIFDGGSYSSGGLFGSSSGLSTGSVAILIVLAVMGASYVNSMTKRTRYFDTAVSVSGMLVGAFVANSLANGMLLPIDSELLQGCDYRPCRHDNCRSHIAVRLRTQRGLGCGNLQANPFAFDISLALRKGTARAFRILA